MARVSLRRCSSAVRSSAGVAAAAVRGGTAAAAGESACIASAGADVGATPGCEGFRSDGRDPAAPACEPALDWGGAAAASGDGLVSGGLTGGAATGGAPS